MSTLRVTNLKGGSAGSAPNLPDGANITGVVTATSFSGSGANLTGIDATALKDGGGSVKIQANSDGAVVTGVLTAPTVSGTTGSFTGNVSVGGTLTYEDVTNVDSVGLITARNGINISGSDLKVGAAFTVGQAGVVTATSFIGSGANLTNLPPGGNQIDLVADGAIAAGKPCIIQTDGKAAQIVENLLPTNPPLGNGDSTVTNVKEMVSWAYDQARNRYVVCGKSGDAYWIYGTNTSGNTTFSWSSQFLLLGYAMASCMACYHESQERTIFMWWNSQFSAATSLMVATHGPDVNSAADFNANNSYQIGNRARPIAAIYYSQVNVCCFMVQDNDSNLGILYMLDTTTSSTISQNVVNKKATITLDGSASIQFGGLATNGTVLVAAYKKGSNSGIYYKIITGTNNTTYTETSEAHYTDGSITVEQMDISYDSNVGKFVLVYKNASGNYLRVVVGTLSGTGSSATISWGTPVEMNQTEAISGLSCEYDPGRKETLVVYSRTDTTGQIRYVSISGTTPTWGSVTQLDGNFYPCTTRGDHFSIVVNPDTNQMAVAWVTGANNSGSASRYELITGSAVQSNLTSANQNFLGFAEDAISDGATGTIKLQGNVVGNQSGLTPATWYAVQNDGTLSSGGSATSAGGLAVASDKLRIKEVPKS
jgi:hypothetical protein